MSLIAAAAGAAATYYLYATKDGARKRSKILRFARDAKDEVTQASTELYENISETMRDKYEDLKNIDKKEVSGLAKRIRGHWDEIREDIKNTLAPRE